jgi:hypothetical protein
MRAFERVVIVDDGFNNLKCPGKEIKHVWVYAHP